MVRTELLTQSLTPTTNALSRRIPVDLLLTKDVDDVRVISSLTSTDNTDFSTTAVNTDNKCAKSMNLQMSVVDDDC